MYAWWKKWKDVLPVCVRQTCRGPEIPYPAKAFFLQTDHILHQRGWLSVWVLCLLLCGKHPAAAPAVWNHRCIPSQGSRCCFLRQRRTAVQWFQFFCKALLIWMQQRCGQHCQSERLFHLCIQHRCCWSFLPDLRYPYSWFPHHKGSAAG